MLVEEGKQLLTITEYGYGKRSSFEDFACHNRGGKGVRCHNITDKTGDLISIQAVSDDNDLMIINRSGVTIRTEVSQIRLAGRATQGVRIINLRDGDAIASVMAVPANDDAESAENITSAEGDAPVVGGEVAEATTMVETPTDAE